jgi:hypothetical protein
MQAQTGRGGWLPKLEDADAGMSPAFTKGQIMLFLYRGSFILQNLLHIT